MKRRYSWPLGTIAALVLVLIAIHLALPYLVRNYLNDKLANMGDYRGDCRCGPGAMARRLPDQWPANRQGGRQGPGAVRQGAADRVRGELAFAVVRPCRRGRGHFVRPQINFVDGGANKQASQTGKGTDWQEQLRKLLPITLNEVRIEDGEIAFHNFSPSPR